ncbi:hypothetical protein [Chamaesiphon sp. VAR_69_metabat_338]|nr:hypothetical protein [Chamaesiphon sp. VAR_69_metabat_338]
MPASARYCVRFWRSLPFPERSSNGNIKLGHHDEWMDRHKYHLANINKLR